jgi:hypothetical protein
MLRWFPRLQVATACFSCSPPDLKFLDPYFIFMYMHYNHCDRATAHLQLNILLLYFVSDVVSRTYRNISVIQSLHAHTFYVLSSVCRGYFKFHKHSTVCSLIKDYTVLSARTVPVVLSLSKCKLQRVNMILQTYGCQ